MKRTLASLIAVTFAVATATAVFADDTTTTTTTKKSGGGMMKAPENAVKDTGKGVKWAGTETKKGFEAVGHGTKKVFAPFGKGLKKLEPGHKTTKVKTETTTTTAQ